MADSLIALLTSVAALGGIIGVILLIGRVLRHSAIGRPRASGGCWS